jgi:CelD/BcsL family acetyltransferase involved in cellulose biosynthesis
VRHHLELTGSVDQVRARFDRKVLQNLRRAERSDLRFTASTDCDAMEIYYRLHVATRRKLGVPVQPRSFFRRLHRRVLSQGLGFVGLVYRHDAAVAGGVFLGHNRVLFAKYLASDPNGLHCYPNEYLLDNAIRTALETGYRVFDLGLSKKEHIGLRRFKVKWGAVESAVFQENISGSCGRLGQDSALLRMANVAIRHSPAAVCRLLGEVFYRYSY